MKVEIVREGIILALRRTNVQGCMCKRGVAAWGLGVRDSALIRSAKIGLKILCLIDAQCNVGWLLNPGSVVVVAVQKVDNLNNAIGISTILGLIALG